MYTTLLTTPRDQKPILVAAVDRGVHRDAPSRTSGRAGAGIGPLPDLCRQIGHFPRRVPGQCQSLNELVLRTQKRNI